MSVRSAAEYLASPLVKARVTTLGAAVFSAGTVAAPTAAELAAVGAAGAPYYRIQILLVGTLGVGVADKGVNAVRFDAGQTGTFTEQSETTATNGNILTRMLPIADDTDIQIVDQTLDGAPVALNQNAFLAVLVPVLP